jgi:hypothetical protein
VKATFVDDIRGAGGEVAGAIEIRRRDDAVRGFAFRCPCGCGQESWLPVRQEKEPEIGRSTWLWDGNETEPTLTPSVFQSGLPCQWHGFLRNGEWVL